MNCCTSTSLSAKSVLPVRFATRFDRSPYLISSPPVYSALVPGLKPLLTALAGRWLNPASAYGFTMNRRPLPIWLIPLSSPASLILLMPNVLRHALHKSSSFFRRINLLKFTPHTTSWLRMKFSV